MKHENIISFYCKHFKINFDLNVGNIDFNAQDGIPLFANTIVCPKCTAKYKSNSDNFSDNFELNEMGQTQLSEIFMNI